MKSSELALFYVPCADEAEAKKLAHALLDAKLIACANIIPGMQSVYVWEGRKEESRESILILKSSQSKREALRKELESLHSYSCPCILELGVASLNQAYADWLGLSLEP